MRDPLLVRFYDSVLLSEAERAVERSQVAKSAGDAVAHAGASFTAIVAAAAATETYLSEILAHLKEKGVITAGEREKIRKKDGLWAKYNCLASLFGTGLHMNPIYSTFQALIHLRNCVVHRSAEYLEPGFWPEEIQPYNKVIPHVSGDGLDWTSQVFDSGTAEWAVRVAKDFLAEVDNYVPDPGRPPFHDPGAVA